MLPIASVAAYAALSYACSPTFGEPSMMRVEYELNADDYVQMTTYAGFSFEAAAGDGRLAHRSPLAAGSGQTHIPVAAQCSLVRNSPCTLGHGVSPYASS